MVRHIAAENILERLSDIHNYPEGSFAPYEEFLIRGKAYYFTPDGFLYRKEDPAAEEWGCLLPLPHRRSLALQIEQGLLKLILREAGRACRLCARAQPRAHFYRLRRP